MQDMAKEEGPQLVSDAHTDVPLTDIQVGILRALEAKCEAANRDREIALAMALAGAGIPNARIIGFDFEAKLVRVVLPIATIPS